MKVIYHNLPARKARPLPVVDFLRASTKQFVLWCYSHRLLSVQQTQYVIDAFRLWEA